MKNDLIGAINLGDDWCDISDGCYGGGGAFTRTL